MRIKIVDTKEERSVHIGDKRLENILRIEYEASPGNLPQITLQLIALDGVEILTDVLPEDMTLYVSDPLEKTSWLFLREPKDVETEKVDIS